jgi:hypothetical protein
MDVMYDGNGSEAGTVTDAMLAAVTTSRNLAIALALSMDRPPGHALPQRLEVEDHIQHCAEQRIRTDGIGAIGTAFVVVILIATLKAFAEIVVIVVLPYIAARSASQAFFIASFTSCLTLANFVFALSRFF